MIARTGAIILGIIVLSFITALLLMDFATPGGFTSGRSLSSFIDFLLGQENKECECEFSSQLGKYVCNPFCGEFAGRECGEKLDCMH